MSIQIGCATTLRLFNGLVLGLCVCSAPSVTRERKPAPPRLLPRLRRELQLGSQMVSRCSFSRPGVMQRSRTLYDRGHKQEQHRISQVRHQGAAWLPCMCSTDHPPGPVGPVSSQLARSSLLESRAAGRRAQEEAGEDAASSIRLEGAPA